jgi:hypothetical protein
MFEIKELKRENHKNIVEFGNIRIISKKNLEIDMEYSGVIFPWEIHVAA